MSYSVRKIVIRFSAPRVMIRAMVVTILVGVSLKLPLRAQGATSEVSTPRSKEDLVVSVKAKAATCMAAFERHDDRILAVGEGGAVAHAQRLWLVYPDSQGDLPDQAPMMVPWPADSDTAYPVSLLFHPHLPILYVWRHAGGVGDTSETPTDFAHLLVYAIGKKGSAPELRASLCSGKQYAARVLPSFMDTDPEGKRLFLPNLRIQPDKGALRSAVGVLWLGDDGLPVMDQEQPLLNLIDLADFQSLPNGWGFCPVNPRLLLMATEGGLLLWDIVDRRAGLSRVLLPQVPHRRQGFLSGDERRIYWAGAGVGTLATMRHADGYPTLMPSVRQIKGAVFSTPPIILSGAPRRLAVGGREEIVLVGLNPDGSFSGDNARLPLPNHGNVSILAYMHQINRLYLPIGGDHER